MRLSRILGFVAALAFAAPALAQVNPGTSPLTGSKGGTNNAFMQFSGPATSLKTYTLPNASGTIGVLNAIGAWTAAQSFTDGTVILLGASSGSSTIKAPATGGGTVTLFPGTDTIVGAAATQTLTNKTFNCANQTSCVVRLGSDVTGSLPLSNIASVAANTVLGQTAAGAPIALTINGGSSCTNALTWVNGTGFGCNISAGTGTVTSVATAGLATGGPITASGTVTVTAASKTDQQTGSSSTVAVTPSQAQSHDSSAKAWALCSSAGATTVGYNATCARTGTGTYTVTFGTAFATVNYACTMSDADATNRFLTGSNTSSTVFSVNTANIGGTATDTAFAIHCFGRQ